MKKRELVVAPLCEAALILVAGVAAWLTHKPLFFASLGPTAFEMIEAPERPSARPYNVILGHFIGVLSGFAALALTNAWTSPGVSTSSISLIRVWAAVLAVLLTVFGTLLARAQQPAALSTSLMIATGSMQRLQDAQLSWLPSCSSPLWANHSAGGACGTKVNHSIALEACPVIRSS